MRPILVALFWAALIFAFVMAVLPRPPQLPGQPSDKVQHILAFTVLSGLALAAFPRAAPTRIFAGLAFVGGLIELVQTIPMLHRDGSFIDFAVDCGAVLVVLTIGVPLRRLIARQFSRAP